MTIRYPDSPPLPAHLEFRVISPARWPAGPRTWRARRFIARLIGRVGVMLGHWAWLVGGQDSGHTSIGRGWNPDRKSGEWVYTPPGPITHIPQRASILRRLYDNAPNWLEKCDPEFRAAYEAHVAAGGEP